MNATQLLTGPLAQAIGWALLHLLWQATIVAGILAGVLALLPRRSANVRYAAACSALALVFAMFVVTAVRAYDPAAASIEMTPAGSAEAVSIPLTQIPVFIAETAAGSVRDRAISALASARNSFPVIVALWLAGVVLLSARLAVAWFRARRLIRAASAPAGGEWQRLAASLGEALGLRRAVRLLQSSAIEVPSVIGSLRPVILIPASALTGLTPEQVEMVLAHELAHIRRHDFLVNLLQAFVETLMFYHPAVWWMSRRVRIERENCCDDLAVAVCGSPAGYARALTRLEELRAATLPVMVAANGGSLIDRIRRIASGREEGTAATSRWAAALTMLVILTVAAVLPSVPALAQRDETAPAAAPAPAASSVDVLADEPDADATPLAALDPLDADLDVPVEVDVDVEIPTPDVDVDTDFDYDYDYDYEYDYEYEYEYGTPAPPAAPVPVVAAVPPAPPVPGMPAIAPRPMATPRPPRPALAPVAPVAPVARHAFDDREFGVGKLTVDELIALRAAGVTPEYVNQMRQIFSPLTIGGVRSLRAVGVTPEFVREMPGAGIELKSALEATRLRAVGVTPEYLAAVKAAGFDPGDVHAVAGLRAVGVTPEYVQQMRAAGFELKSAKDATNLRAVGVTPEYVQQMRATGFELSSARDVASLRAVGVTPEYVQQMRAAGFELKSAKDAASLRAVGVTPEYMREMRAAGVKIESAKDAASLKAVGVTPEFVKRLAAAGYTGLTARDLARLAGAGVDDGFIRDLEQYRKKN